MTDSVCVCCGVRGHVEWHHVGGRKHSDVVTPVCSPCHRILSAWQSERTWDIDRPVDRVVVETLDILRMMVRHTDCGDSAIAAVEHMSELIKRSGVFIFRPLSYDLDIPEVIPDSMWEHDSIWEYDWFVTDVTLLQDVARTVLNSTTANPLTDSEVNGLRVQILTQVSRLDAQRAYREMGSRTLGDVLRYLLVELETIIGQAMLDLSHDNINPLLDLNRDDRMPLDLRVAILTLMMRGLRDKLTIMTSVEPSPMDG
jgi:hypothetical protein